MHVWRRHGILVNEKDDMILSYIIYSFTCGYCSISKCLDLIPSFMFRGDLCNMCVLFSYLIALYLFMNVVISDAFKSDLAICRL